MNSLSTQLKHVAIIMDGNRTWATQRGLPKLLGHTEGAKSFKKIIQEGVTLDIPFLTFWALSTENLLNRSEEELKHLFSLFTKLVDYIADLKNSNIKFNTIGNISKLPSEVQNSLTTLVKSTKKNTGMVLTLAVNYGGRDEILRAVNKMISKGEKNITEEIFEQYLDTKDLPNVDLIIRTSDYQRLSGYLPWQSTYAELYFTKTKWPAFRKKDFHKAIDWFLEQKRNNGK